MGEKRFLDKVLKFLGIEEEEAATLEDVKEKGPTTLKQLQEEANKSDRFRVSVVAPVSYDDVQSIADHLKREQPVIVSLEKLEKGTAKRILDFLAGAMYALDGELQRLNDTLFLITPKNVEVDGRFYSLYEDKDK